MWTTPIRHFGCACALLAICTRVSAQGQDAQQMRDLIMKNAPAELKQKMEAARRSQEEERRNPGRNVPPRSDAPSGPVDLAQFLRGNWVSEPFRGNCETGRVGEGPYVWGNNSRFEVHGNEIHEYHQQWGGPGYNCLHRIRHRVVSIANTRKDDSSPFPAKQVAEINAERIDSEAMSGGCRFTSRLTSVWQLKYADAPKYGFKGRAIDTLLSCEGEFRNFDSAATPTRGVR